MDSRSTEQSISAQVDDSLTSGQLALVTFARLATTTAFRILYPLLPFLSLQLDVDLRTVSILVTVQVLASALSPLGGALADKRGARLTMSMGLILFCAGAALCAISTAFPAFLVGYVLIGLAVALYQPAAQSYVSWRTSYARRGRALGIFEISWAAAALIGVAPLMQVVQVTHTTTPVFLVLLVLAGVSLALIRFALPPSHHVHVHGGPAPKIDWQALKKPAVLAMMALMGLMMSGYDLYLVVQGAWLKTSLGATEGQLGQLFALIGISELVGSLLVVLIVDRIGKKRSVVAGFVLTAICMAGMPLAAISWLTLIPLFFLFYVSIEFAIVAAIPLASGVAPAARGTALALIFATGSLGRAIGSLASEPLWSRYGMIANTTLAAVLILVGVFVCVAFVRETEIEHH